MTTACSTEEIRIERWFDQPAEHVSRMHLEAGIDAIFWATAARPITDPNCDLRSGELSETQQVARREREAFRNLWLADYLQLDQQLAWLALTPANDVVGYLVGTLALPIGNPRFAALGYFDAFAACLRNYPAHLHINLDEAWRNRGIGRRLIDAFADQVRAAGLRGFHVVTGATSRNVAFYARAGFVEIARTPWKSGEVVMLGREVPSLRE